MKTLNCYKKKNSYFYICSLFILTLFSVLQRNVYFANSEFFFLILNVIEMISYIVLAFLIVQKRYSSKALLLVAILGTLLLIGYLRSGMAIFFRALLLIFASKDIKLKTIIRTMLKAFITGIIISILLYVVGMAPDIRSIYHYEGIGLGFGVGNTLGELICVSVMMDCYLRCYDGKSIKILPYFGIGILLYIITTSKTATIILLLTPIVVRYCNEFFRLYKHKYSRLFVYLLFPFLFVFSYASALLFTSSTFVQKLDLILTNRFFLNSYAINKYPLTFFGQEVFLHDTGVYNAVRGIGNITVTVDSSYILSIVSLGIIPSLIFVVAYWVLIKKAFDNRQYTIVGIAILLCLYGFTEVHMLNLYDNFVYLSILSIFQDRNYLSRIKTRNKLKRVNLIKSSDM